MKVGVLWQARAVGLSKGGRVHEATTANEPNNVGLDVTKGQTNNPSVREERMMVLLRVVRRTARLA